MVNPLDKIPSAQERSDSLEKIKELFEVTKETLSGKKSKQEITAADVDTISQRGQISKLINHKFNISDGTLNTKLEVLVQRYGIDNKYYHAARKNVLPEIKKAGYEIASSEYADSWSHFHPVSSRNKTKERIQNKNEGVEIEISYKVYFTLTTEGAQTGKNIDRFIKRLPEIAAALEAIAAKCDARITFKIPEALYEMLFLRDSLVIHTNKKDILEEIHTGVTNVLTENDKPVAIERDERGHFGYDFTSTDERYSGSYSELLSRVVAGRLASIGFDNPNLLQQQQSSSFEASFLKPILKTTATWSPQRMAEQLQDPLNRRVNS